MGRYAFFTTNFEYKFRFGVQPSEDIRFFGGVGSYDNYDDGYLTHSWNKKDCEGMLEDIKALAEGLDVAIPDFATYENSLNGTYTLKFHLYDLYKKDVNEEVVARFILGCVIYHQLQYTEELFADYES